MRKFLLSLIGISIFGLLSAQSLVFHEDFELPSGADSLASYSSSGSNTWGLSTDLYASGMRSDSAKCTPNDTLTLTTNSFSTVGNAFVVLDFDHICKIEAMDKAIVEVSTDNGLTWTKLDTNQYMGNSTNFGSGGNVFNATSYGGTWKSGQTTYTPNNTWWKHETFNISSLAANTASVQVRFSLIDANGMTFFENYGWFLDNIEISASPSELVPPDITMITPIVKDTITTSAPQTILAKITDNSGIDTAFVVYYVNGVLTDTLGMNNFSADSFKVDIPFPGYGRTITYFVEAIDQAAVANHNTSSNYSYFVKFVPGALNSVVYSQDFNAGALPTGWVSSSMWQHNTGSTTSGSTGPSGPYEGTGYAFAETSVTHPATGTLTSTTFNLSALSKPYMVFYYHMYGATMGTLAVDVYDGSAWHNSVWSISGEQHSSETAPWTKAMVDLTPYKNAGMKIRFSCTTTTSWTSDMAIDDVQIGETQLAVPDAGIAQITNPTGGVVANTNFDVKAKFKNKGGVDLTKVDIDWEVDGTPQTTYAWTGTLNPDSLSAELTLGTQSVTAGPHSLKIWTTNPNDTIDFNIANDTMHFNFYGCANLLSGNYTIGGATADFQTFNEAVLGLTQCGISGPVTFNVNAGTYNEQIYLPAISGASATNTITFQSASGDSADVVLKYNANGAADNYVVELDGASNIAFKEMTFESEDSSNAIVVNMLNHTSDIEFMNNRFVSMNLMDAAAERSLVFTEDTLGSNISFANNRFVHGSNGLVLSGHGMTNVDVSNNIFVNQYAGAAQISGADAAVVKYNTVTTASTFNSYNAFFIDNASGAFEVSYNNIAAENTAIGYGIFINESAGDSLNHAMVYNNMALVNGNANNNDLSAGIINLESRFVDYYYNTVKMTGNDQNTVGMAIYDNTAGISRGVIVKNNIFANMASGYAVFTLNINSANITNDYNNLYTDGNGDYISLNGNIITDISEWQLATGEATHSVNIDPYFAATTDLHTTNNLMNATGTPISAITDDIDGDTRNSTTPDMGADEFDPSPYDITLLEIMSPQSACGLTSTEDVTLRIKNIGSASVTSFSATYQVLNGSSAVTEAINTTLNPGDTLDYTFNAKVDMDVSAFMKDSVYPFVAYVNYSSDPIQQNDTIYNDINSQYQPPAPTTTPYTINYGDSVTITATSNDTLYWYDSDTASAELASGTYFTTPQLYDTTTYWVEARPGSGKLRITEVTQYQGFGTGATTPEPAWLIGDDFVEITNLGTAPVDLTGYVYNREGTGAFTYNLPAGLVLNAGEVLVLATYQGGSDDPANNYYVAASSSTSSGSATGHWLVDDQGAVVDAVALNGHSFSSSAVTAADWSGSIPSSSGDAGVVRTIDDNNTASDWQISSVVPQTLGAVNPALAGNLSGSGSSSCPSARVPVVINVIGFPMDDAGISAVVNPIASVPSGTKQYIDVELNNFGLNTLTSADITWELDGQVQNTYSWTGSIPYGDKDTIRIDSTTFSGGVYTIKTWSSLPNNMTDTINSNDTTQLSFNACLNGYYTIGDTAQGAYDFSSFTDAVNALVSAGVCGHVVFEADSGLYTEQLSIPAIPGADANNTITFTSTSGDSSDVVLSYAASSSTSAYTVLFDGAEYITFKNMTLKGTGSSYARVVMLENSASHLTFENNMFDLPVSTSANVAGIYSTGNNNDYIKVRNNYFMNGGYPIRLYGSGSSSRAYGNHIEGNYIDQFGYSGIYTYYQDSITVIGNTVIAGSNSNFTYGISINYSFDGSIIANNDIRIFQGGTSTKYGLRVYYNNYYNYAPANPQPVKVYNNMVNISAGTGTVYGIYAYYGDNIKYYYNTVNITSSGSNVRPLYQTNTASNTIGQEFVNNMFIDSAGTSAAAYFNTPSTVSYSDYNNYYSIGTTLAYWGSDQPTLADLQAASGMDANSMNMNPLFMAGNDLHLKGKAFAGSGTPISGITTDIDGDPRSPVMPTIGADEVEMVPFDIGIAEILNVPANVHENDTIYPEVVVINAGTDTVANYSIDYYINGGTAFTLNVTNDTILPFGDTDTFNLAYYVSPAGLYTFCASTVLNADSNQYNDELCTDVFATPIYDGFTTSIDDLESGCGLVDDTISITIKNIGVDTIQPGFPAKYMVDGITLVEDTVNTQLLPGDSVYFQFSQLVDLTVTTFDSTFNIAAWIEVPGDNVTYNDTVYVSTVSKHIPAVPVVNDLAIGYGSTAMLVGNATAPIAWYYSDTSSGAFHVGDTLLTNILYDDTTFWFNAINGTSGTPLMITEIGVGATDYIEIQNISNSQFDATGYQVVISDDYSNINDLNSITWSLGMFQPGEVQYRSDATGSNYWGNNIMWNPGSTYGSWAIILDPNGEVVDAIIWNHSQSVIATMNLTVGLFSGVNVNNQWTGDGFDQSTCGDEFGRATYDSDDATDWTCFTTPSMGTANSGMHALPNFSIAGCQSARDSVNITVVVPTDNAGITDISVPSGCALSMEPVTIDIVNNGTDPINGNLTASYKVDNNPYISPENVSLNIPPYDTASYTFTTLADLSGIASGDTAYIINAYVVLAGDTLNYNDSIISDTIHSLYTPVAPITSDTLGFYGDSLTISAVSKDTLYWFDSDTSTSSIFVGKYFTTPVLFDTTTYYVEARAGQGVLTITEVTQFSTGTGGTSPKPSYLQGDDFVEIANLGSAPIDLSGYTYHREGSSSSYDITYNLPSITLDVGELIVLGTQTTAADDPANNFYVAGNYSVSSSTLTGHYIKSSNGSIVDAVSLNGYAFSAASGVTAADWSGSMPSSSGDAGVHRISYDSNTPTDWVVATSADPQTIGSMNNGLNTSNGSGCASPRVPLTVFIDIPDANAAITDVLVNSGCNLKMDESITIEVANLGGQPINGNATVSYRVNGGSFITPENMTTVIPPSDTAFYTFTTTHNMLAPFGDTTFVVEAYISLVGDTFPANDSLMTDTLISKYTPPLPVASDTTINFGTFATLKASNVTPNLPDTTYWYETQTSANPLAMAATYTTPLLYDTTTYWVSSKELSSVLAITEVTQYQGFGTGATSPLPSYMSGDDFVELTNLGPIPVDITGYTYHREGASSSYDINYSLPSITLQPGEVIVLGTQTSSADDPANNFYVAANASVSSSTETGHYILNNDGLVVDAVALNGYDFSANSPVSSADWNGTMPSSSGDAGVSRISYGANNETDWTVSTTAAPQTLGTLNSSLGAVSAVSAGGCESDRIPVTVFVSGAPDYDGQLKAIVEPSSGFFLSSQEPVVFRVLNNGLDTINTVNLAYEMPGQLPVSEVVNQQMLPGDTLLHTFGSTVDLSAFGSYSIKGYISVPNDTVNLNDTLFKSIQNKKDYCISTATSSSYNYIENVTLADLNNTSMNSAQYTDYTNSVPAPIVYLGIDHPMSITWGSTSTYFQTIHAKVFIDVNRDGVYDEATETFFNETISSSTVSTFANDINIPSSATPGVTGMRIVLERTANASDVHPCGTYTYGETEDYLVQLTPLIPEDAGVIAINKPEKFVINANQQFEVVVKNFGSAAINSVDINYTLGSTVNTFTYNGVIAPQAQDTVSMPILTLPYGNLNLCAYTVLSGDSNMFNDSYCKSIYRSYTTTPPYYDGFEVNNYFMQDTTTTKITQWELGYPMANNIIGTHSGNNAWMIDLDSNYLDATTDVLYSPRFAIGSQGVDSLVFWHWMDAEQGNDGGYVQYLNVTGNWTTLGMVNDPTAVNWYTDTIVGQPGFSGNTNGWVRASISLDTANVSNMASITQFRFVFSADATGNSGDGWAIDDFEVKIPQMPYDAGVKKILTPVDSTITGDQVTVSVEIKNYGLNTLSNMPIVYQIGSSTPVTENWSGSLAPGAVMTYTFNTAYTGPSSDYTLCVRTEHPQDGNISNDEKCRNLFAKQPAFDAGVVDVHPIVSVTPLPGPDTTWFGELVEVEVSFANFGSSPITSLDLEYQRGTQPAVAESWTGNLLPGDTTTYVFTQTYTSGIGLYTICGKTILTGDADNSNDETCEQWTGAIIDFVESKELDGFVLNQNIPNPVNDLTKINYKVPYGGKAKFEIVDVFGRTLKELDLNVSAGTHTIDVNASGWAAGVYYYSITFDGYKLVKKMTIVK